MATRGRWPADWCVLPALNPGHGRKIAARGLRPGDVLLHSPLTPTLLQVGIRAAQSGAFKSPHTRFTHVALYVGRGRIVDATPAHGVAQRAFLDFAAGAHVRVRRLAGVSAATQAAVAREARRWARSQRSYAHIAAAAAAFAAHASPAPGSAWAVMLRQLVEAERTRRKRDGRFACACCGDLVDDILAVAANRSIIDDSSCYSALPAAFSANTTEFVDPAGVRW